MRILVLGAGAVGGFFGGKLLNAGRDVTFLVRGERARRLTDHGMQIRSANGIIPIAPPPILRAEQLDAPFDLILLSCKAYDLKSALESLAPAVGENTLILPLLNGLLHFEELDRAFGQKHVLGGTCFISARLDTQGNIQHLSEVQKIAYGARHESQIERIPAITQLLSDCDFEVFESENILFELWEKFALIASIAGLTCLFRGTLGDLNQSGGSDIAAKIWQECIEVAAENDIQISSTMSDFALRHLTSPDSHVAASMLGDMERHGPTEADHIFEDLLRRRQKNSEPDLSMLKLAAIHLRVYRERLIRESHIIV